MQSATLRQDARVIALVGLSHGVSHFYHLILAAVFPWLKPAFDLTYAELGLLMTVFFVISGIGQVLAGFVVDRIGAIRVLMGGLALLGVAAVVLAGAQSYPMLMFGSLIAGLGNSVFHPADYTLLNQRVSTARLAHGFSVHGISGNLGWAAAPVFLGGVAALSSWRSAVLASAIIPVVMLLLIFFNRAYLCAGFGARKIAGPARESRFAFLRLPTVWMCFGFFFLSSIALGGIQSFAATSLMALYQVSLASAATAYTAYMLASAAGMIAGGFIATRARNHDRTIVIAFALSASLALLLALAVVPAAMVIPLMGAIGLASGVAGPSRDLLIRSAAPANASGRVFGVVYSGLDSGMAVGPLLFGALMDAGHPSWVFICIGLFQALSIATAVGVGGSQRAPVLQKA